MDYINALRNQMQFKNCFNNFGELLLALSIKGVKGTNCEITFDFPVTAISGINGAGKSTIAQIALCAYKGTNSDDVKDRSYLKDFFVKTLLDKQPYTPTAEIIATYATQKSNSTVEQLTLLAVPEKEKYEKTVKMYYTVDRWAGYKSQPMRKVFYYGMSYFIPYQEQNSNLLGDNKAHITNISSFRSDIVSKVADILSIKYNDLQHNSIKNDKREEQVISASKSNIIYSENHMGCGEGRLLKLVDALESAPNKSLFVIEEPETALHQLAQHKLSQYFMDVCYRKKHQIIFTTHSSAILTALPPEARKFIVRDVEKTRVVSNPTIAEVDNMLSGGHYKGLTIVTEDKIGELYLKQILRKFSPHLFQNCSIYGLDLGYVELKTYVSNAKKCDFHICGVVDESRRKEVDNFIAAFPEDVPPEQAFFKNEFLINFIKTEYNIDCSTLSGDHHSYFNKISREANEDEQYLIVRCIKEYVNNQGKDYYNDLINSLSLWLKNSK